MQTEDRNAYGMEDRYKKETGKEEMLSGDRLFRFCNNGFD